MTETETKTGTDLLKDINDLLRQINTGKLEGGVAWERIQAIEDRLLVPNLSMLPAEAATISPAWGDLCDAGGFDEGEGLVMLQELANR